MTTPILSTAFIYAVAAIAEIAGCFAFWAWLRLGKSVWWTLPGTISLTIFALLLTRIDSDAAGRAFAAYGGVYIAASLVCFGVLRVFDRIAGISLALRFVWLGRQSSCSRRVG